MKTVVVCRHKKPNPCTGHTVVGPEEKILNGNNFIYAIEPQKPNGDTLKIRCKKNKLSSSEGVFCATTAGLLACMDCSDCDLVIVNAKKRIARGPCNTFPALELRPTLINLNMIKKIKQRRSHLDDVCYFEIHFECTNTILLSDANPIDKCCEECPECEPIERRFTTPAVVIEKVDGQPGEGERVGATVTTDKINEAIERLVIGDEGDNIVSNPPEDEKVIEAVVDPVIDLEENENVVSVNTVGEGSPNRRGLIAANADVIYTNGKNKKTYKPSEDLGKWVEIKD